MSQDDNWDEKLANGEMKNGRQNEEIAMQRISAQIAWKTSSNFIWSNQWKNAVKFNKEKTRTRQNQRQKVESKKETRLKRSLAKKNESIAETKEDSLQGENEKGTVNWSKLSKSCGLWI